MNGSLRNYMKVGIVHFMAFPATAKGDGPILENLAKIAYDDFFGAIEVTSIPDPATRARRQARHQLDRPGQAPVRRR